MKKNILIPAALSVFGLLFGTFAFVQSDETKESKESKTIEKKVEVKVIGDVNADNITIDGDKIKVRLPNGETQIIDLKNIRGGAHKIEIDGDDLDIDVQVQGKAVIIGPDGNVKEYDLNDEEFGIELPENDDMRSMFERFRRHLPDFDSKIFPQRILPDQPVEVLPVSKFMIGVGMGPTSEILQVQLGLDTPGIAVLEVMPDSPAAKAKIQKHDVLVAVGGQPLKEISELISAVEKSGTEKAELIIKIIRQGKAMEVKLIPVKRPETEVRDVDTLPLLEELNNSAILEQLRQFNENKFRQSISQGVLPADVDDEFEELFKTIEQHIQKLREKNESK
ncbi:MAG: hypothetical protein CMJ76_07755 [Planctomycetaceae bacterium]|nr:hypothetical protein [Planctomycetaceae bacterium]|tara:strand:- start:958 stop:1965 length:1008 start_codon:yes stop_codon:yes gene_type:complete